MCDLYCALGKEAVMVTAIVLVNVRRDAVNETAQALTGMDGISEVYSVAGEYDLVAIIRAKGNDQLAEIVTGHMLKLDGISKTETLIAFRTYSKHDLERMFSIGFKEG
jgi:DNA-binding Lrp family transcriptional regulator